MTSQPRRLETLSTSTSGYRLNDASVLSTESFGSELGTLAIADPLPLGSGRFRSSNNRVSTTSGTLASTDPTNPTRSGSFHDDYFLTGVVAGRQVRVKLNSSDFDTYLQVVNADTGAVVFSGDDSGRSTNSRLTFTAQAGTNYVLRTTSYGSGVTGDYTLRTNLGTSTSGTPISGNQTINGSLATTDSANSLHSNTYYDGYLLSNLVAGQQVQVNLNARFDTYLQVLNADTGAVVAYDNDSGTGRNSRLTFTVQDGINYILRATSFGTNVTGNYTLSTTTLNTNPINNPINNLLVPISGNQSLNGTLSITDPNNPSRNGSYYDGYRLTGVSVGQAVQVNLTASSFDTYLQVLNADTGQVIAFNDDANGSVNSQLAFSVESGIDYVIRATSYRSGVTGSYTITTQAVTIPSGFDPNYGYGLVDAAAAVASGLGQTPFADVTNRGGNDWGRDLINAPEVWARGYTGQNVVVAVVDTGVDYNHTDLSGNIWLNSNEISGNGIDDDGNGFVDDIRGWDFVDGDNNPMDLETHGTHVAGIIAARDDGAGITGVAPSARIMPVRVLDANGRGSSSNIASGIRYAVDNGANVINLSLGGGFSRVIQSAIQYAATQGAVVVMASGNEYGSQPSFPANLADQWGIAVGAVNSTNAIAGFSNDAGITPLDYVVAPGVDVYSTTPNNTYAYKSGTSMATPHVAGVAALMLSANPNLTPTQVENIITESANPTGITV